MAFLPSDDQEDAIYIEDDRGRRSIVCCKVAGIHVPAKIEVSYWILFK